MEMMGIEFVDFISVSIAEHLPNTLRYFALFAQWYTSCSFNINNARLWKKKICKKARV